MTIIILSIIFLIVDQITKILVVNSLVPGENIEIIKNGSNFSCKLYKTII